MAKDNKELQKSIGYFYLYMMIGYIFGAIISHAPKKPITMTVIGGLVFTAIFGLLYIAYGVDYLGDNS